MSGFLTVLVIVLIFVVIFQIAKASEYVSILKGEKKSRQQSNRINGFLMIAFLVLGLFGAYYCNETLKGKILGESASVQGEGIDTLIYVTLGMTGFVCLITQVLLFWFAFKYQEKEGRVAFYFPHNNKLEVIWTVIPAIALTILVAFGLKHWFAITSEAPKDAMIVEVTGKQFNWLIRYPGKDGQLGSKKFALISDVASNPVGQDWEDNLNKDDFMSNEIHLVVGKPVKFIIGSRDVIHDVGLPQFRMKMDAVPGIPTTLWITPKFTTTQMKDKTGNPDFVYELSCDQMCGAGHFSMRAVIVVETQQDFDAWAAKQKSQYELANASVTPAPGAETPGAAAPAKDSAATKTVAANLPK